MTTDGRWIHRAAIQYDKTIDRLAKALEVEFIREDERFSAHKNMIQHIEELVEILEPAFAKKTLAEWNEILTAADIPFEIVQTMEEIAVDPQAWANDYIFKKEQKDGKNIYFVRTPIVFTEQPAVKEESGRGRSPKLGEDSVEILKELGYDDATIEEFKNNGVIVG